MGTPIVEDRADTQAGEVVGKRMIERPTMGSLAPPDVLNEVQPIPVAPVEPPSKPDARQHKKLFVDFGDRVLTPPTGNNDKLP
jgi:hypothetical protein